MLAVFATNKTQNQTTQENLAKTEHFERERGVVMVWVREGKMVVVAAVLACAIMVMVPEVEAVRWIVGSDKGWTTNVNYTIWAQDKHFYNGDWLFFVYDRNLMDVLEVNKTDYESCNSDHPLKNWTTKVGRDVVPLNETRQYYLISGKGFCYGGMKLTVLVENPPPPPTASPITSSSPSSIYRGQIVLPVVFAIGAMWDAFIRFW